MTHTPIADAFKGHKDADEAADMCGMTRRKVYRQPETEELHTHMASMVENQK